jgi:hypothetical protein
LFSRILRIVKIRQRSPADAKVHRTMPFDQDGKRRIVVRSNEAHKQFAIRQLAVRVHRRQVAQLLQNTGERLIGHGSDAHSNSRQQRSLI